MTNIDKFIEGLLPEKKEPFVRRAWLCHNLESILECDDPNCLNLIDGKKKEDCSFYRETCIESESFDEYNQVIEECRLAIKKAFEDGKIWRAVNADELEELIKESSLCHVCLANAGEAEKEMTELAQNIIKLLSGKE